ncbi:PLP-dependent aminotransferase family protein [Phyllobacterium myrsinacearum]|uniref:GntR family transcriptional regulator n=1 Tax=Phyllobacterium myrsinacearum TaxID=28101 RepID=A0A2S9JY96_9HYPH|nr:PLP-dependent aminotransferase family protein [Phyllobacterium myrsinacearum]PRD58296.1 GntR family transcriptional regulator [Phyllobacterium myrsinacearum]PWV96513.1 DNA-binding transcriptional MocR family regulator [Phyllobacterium myrsinacearum]RZV09497.1 DNA-binding transcriptional MocR family regulator [Phyllobacterium myrsinacearum]
MDEKTEIAGRDATLVERVMQAIRQRIAARTLGPGARLPSIRSFAATMQVSKSTIVEAYDRLAADGTIQSRRGSGFYVAGHMPPLSLAEIGPRLDHAIDPLWVSRLSLDADDGMPKPGCGWLPASWMPEVGVRRALRTLARADDALLTDYATPLGLKPLRQLLARRMAEHGIEAAPDQIMITESGTQAIDLLCRSLVGPGDAVIVDDPCYFNFHALLRAHRVKIVSVPYTPHGPDLERFAEALAEHRPRLYITNSALHNPTGAVLSPVIAHRLLKLAEQHDLTIVEDDIFADFEHEPAPRLAAFDGLERVIHMGSFSKSLSASVRCGFIAARRDWIDGLVDLRIATSFGGGRLSSELVLLMLKDGTYRKHMDHLRARLAHCMGETSVKLKALGIMPWIEPRGGMFLWCKLPEGIDAGKVAQAGLRENIVFAPGNVFSQTHSADNYMRFNVAQCADPRILHVLETTLNGREHALER